MPTYLVVTPLLTSDGRVEPGETVDLKVKDARELLALGAITKEVPAPALASTPAPAPAASSAPQSSTGGGEANASQTEAAPPSTPPAAG